jgi:diaminohydroxyphosphoribosylaminopyrimidine deaminase/5-amino-6-(5-phosphoribosylamino)uracil reductase
VQVIRVRSGDSGVDLAGMLEELGRRRIMNLFVEGGAHVLGSFIESGLADEFFFFYAPKILADPNGVSMLSGRPRMKISDCVQAYEIGARKIGGDLLVYGRFREQIY